MNEHGLKSDSQTTWKRLRETVREIASLISDIQKIIFGLATVPAIALVVVGKLLPALGILELLTKPLTNKIVPINPLSILLTILIAALLILTGFLIKVHAIKRKYSASRYIIKFGIKWDIENDLAPTCPADDTPLSEYGYHNITEHQKNVEFGFKCLKCDKIITLKNEDNPDIEHSQLILPNEAKQWIRKNMFKIQK